MLDTLKRNQASSDEDQGSEKNKSAAVAADLRVASASSVAHFSCHFEQAKSQRRTVAMALKEALVLGFRSGKVAATRMMNNA